MMIPPLKAILLCLLAAAFFVSCEKDVHENVLIEGNEPPPFHGVSSVEVNNFLNNLYIDFLGRGPSVTELSANSLAIKAAEFSDESMVAIASDLQNRYEYFKNYDALTKQRILASIDSLSILYDILLYESLIATAELTGDTVLAQLYGFYLRQYEELSVATLELSSGAIDLGEYYYRNVLNNYYDEINMGSENYALACFENLFYREPTTDELAQTVNMIDGGPGFLFLLDGNSKQDFVEICVGSQAFLEGQAVEVYRALLARDPNSVEMADALALLLDGGDWKTLQREIILKEEYAGF